MDSESQSSFDVQRRAHCSRRLSLLTTKTDYRIRLNGKITAPETSRFNTTTEGKDEVEPIGTIHSPFTDVANMPIQPHGAADVEGTVHIWESYVEGLKDLEGFSHIYLIYLFHKAERISLTVTPFMDATVRGVFATRSPLRPNHIGLSIVQLVKIENGILTVKGVDVLDGTPLLDIKPYIRNFDSVEKSLSGWMVASKDEVAKKRSDGRFK